MRLRIGAFIVGAFAVLPTVAWTPAATTKTDKYCGDSLNKLTAAAVDGSLKTWLARKGVQQDCDISKAKIRRDYSTLSNDEKLHYSNSVKCLMSKPSKIPAGLAPGAISRYDDFVVIHVNMTNWIHDTGNFFAWHRYYIWAFERALQDECGFEGTLPYWNWAKTSEDVMNSPYFDGSEYSQGGNGVWAPHNCTRFTMDTPCMFEVIEGQGGGCVESGPYAGIKANVSGVDVKFNLPNEPNGAPMSYQPRCMKRDISQVVASINTDDRVYDRMANPANAHMASFQLAIQFNNGPHGMGHFTYGGNPGGDIFVSPGDPMFWLHHGAVDRAWWCWQNNDLEERMFQINGTRTMGNIPPSDMATIDDPMFLDWITPVGMGESDPQRNHVSSLGGPYCYIYVDDGCKNKSKRSRT